METITRSQKVPNVLLVNALSELEVCQNHDEELTTLDLEGGRKREWK